ncbi:hypothetical protein IHE44_0003644 [Lamprotornis superbus]|uniref:alpha-1,2-Mannosidase n=1 Tax=Lamprotornis superbus TaxID=245042 RepID=A0A835NRU3_9PASS|nr:hypothetical protein IHE44_0003644 [Lamprotornis superbus]
MFVMGNSSEFQKAVKLVIDTVSFDKDSTVQVFEATIRVLGSLLSAHIIITDTKQPFGDMTIKDYDNELLHLAHDLAVRLLPAFENTKTGIPYPRVNLKKGVPPDSHNETCTAGAGSLLVEFGILSRLLGDSTFEWVARRAVKALWSLRSNNTGLLGNVVNIQTGHWVGKQSGLGAGSDSFYEYLLKSYILFGEKEDLEMFNAAYQNIQNHLRRGREACNEGEGDPPLYVNVNMYTGQLMNTWIDSLQAFFPGLQVLIGDVEDAICLHAFYYAIWKRYGALPERYNWQLQAPDVPFYPLRPELVESTYLLYQATKNPFYLHVGMDILQSLEKYTKAKCGYATLHHVVEKTKEDRMESFFLSETCKYLYLLFDEENPVHKSGNKFMFTTEGHIVSVDERFRSSLWEDILPGEGDSTHKTKPTELKAANFSSNCNRVPDERRYLLPLKSNYMRQIDRMENRNSRCCDAERCWERCGLCFRVRRAGGAWTEAGMPPGGWEALLPTHSRGLGSQMLLLGQLGSSSPGIRNDGLGAQHSIPHWLCKLMEWQCQAGQHLGLAGQTPGQTHPQCSAGSSWSRVKSTGRAGF